MAIRKGSRVRSVRVGRRGAFVGVVVAVVKVSVDPDTLQPGRGKIYVVRDDKGTLWCRTRRELTPETTQ